MIVFENEKVKKRIEELGISNEDIESIIISAEESGEKFYQAEENKFLAKGQVNEAMIYVIYSIKGEKEYMVHSLYSHKARFVG